MKINPDKAEYEKWFEDYHWDKCALNNKDYGRYISSYVRNQGQELVLNLNGAWGTGKTHFLKQLYTDLLNTHGCPTVHINAWSSDFTNDPLLVIVTELIDQLHKIQDRHLEVFDKLYANVGVILKKSWNIGVSAGSAYVANKFMDKDGTSAQVLSDHLKFREPSSIGRSLSAGYRQQAKAIEDTKLCLKEYITSLHTDNNTVYVLIDELDRCRPTYAIELLETIKHFFNIPNFVFIVATDTEQLSHSIKAVYGSDFDGKEYLSRFFNRTATLPQPNREAFLINLLSGLKIGGEPLVPKLNTSNLFPVYNSNESWTDVIPMLSASINAYRLRLRAIEQVVAKFHSIVVTEFEKDENVVFDYNMLFILLIENSSSSEKVKEVYEKRKEEIDYNFNLKPQSGDSIHYHTYLDLIYDDKYRQLNSFSWMFANNFETSKTDSSTSNNIVYMLDNLENSNSTHNKKSYKIATVRKLNTLTNKNLNVWDREEYFRAVELAQTLS